MVASPTQSALPAWPDRANRPRETNASDQTFEPFLDSQQAAQLLRVQPTVLNLAEAARFVRCSRSHLSNIVKGKVKGIPRLPSVRVGRRILFRRESLEQWLEHVESTGLKRNRLSITSQLWRWYDPKQTRKHR